MYSRVLVVRNSRNIFSENADLGLIAIGVTIVLIAGGFDLSVGAVYALGAVIAGKLALGGTAVPVAILAACAAGAFVGLINGFLINKLYINAFIATLGTSSVVSAFAYLYSHSQEMLLTQVPGFVALGQNRIIGIPWSVVLLALAFVIGGVMLHRTVLGRAYYAIGGNRVACQLAGMRVTLLSGSTYVISGFCAALAGVVVASSTGAAQANLGGNIALEAFAVVIVGGTSLWGGEGAMWRTLVGLLILGSLGNLFDSLAMSQEAQLFAQGTILIAAVGVDAWSRRRAGN
jgi:ribose/xylose/arabinose/galactoside ABC-type transport system permease subunit